MSSEHRGAEDSAALVRRVATQLGFSSKEAEHFSVALQRYSTESLLRLSEPEAFEQLSLPPALLRAVRSELCAAPERFGSVVQSSQRHRGSMLDDNKKIGIGLCGIGVLCVTLGIFLLFDRTLLALGNVAFLFGLALLLGPFKAFKFFFRKEKWKGTTGYFLGIAIIIVGWPFFGFLTEMYGIWKLFAAFLPNVLASLKMTVPGAATVLNMWPLSSLCNLINDQRRLPV
eukprot:s245_g23.t1